MARTFRRLDLDWRDHVDLQESLRRPSVILFSVGDPGPMQARHGWRARMDIDEVIDALLAAASA